MSNKLTKKKIDLLIEQVLNEKKAYSIDPDKDVVGRNGMFGNKYKNIEKETGLGDDALKVKIKALANLDKPKKELTVDDFDDAASKHMRS